MLADSWRTELLNLLPTPPIRFEFYLQIDIFLKWSRGGSNPRPPPCKVRTLSSWTFALVQKYLQNRTFTSDDIRSCSLLFAWVGVLLVYIGGSAVRKAIGDDVHLMVDVNNAWMKPTALEAGREFERLGVHWFEEPVPTDDREGL